jgi:very-short-patch-repair endonuclease
MIENIGVGGNHTSPSADGLGAVIFMNFKCKIIMQRTELPDMFYGTKRAIFQNACELRQNMTIAEKHLWERINKDQLGTRFKAQHPIDIFIVDFYCHKFRLVIEVDGEIHLSQKNYDEGRATELERFDLTVIRFTNNEVLNETDRVVEEIKKYLKPPQAPV